MNKTIIWALVMGLLAGLATAFPTPTVDGNWGFVDDSNAYLGGTWITNYGDEFAYYQLKTKTYTGDITLVYLYDNDDVHPVSLEVQNGTRINATGGVEATWRNLNVNPDDKVSINIEGMNTARYKTGVPVTAGTLYNARIRFSDFKNHPGSNKYYFCAYPSSYGSNIQTANANGHLYCLDPYYDYTSQTTKGCWDLTNNANDYYGVYNGTLTGTPTALSKGYRFDGTDDMINFTTFNPSTEIGSGEFAWSVWFNNTDATPEYRWLIDFGDKAGAYADHIGLRMNNSGQNLQMSYRKGAAGGGEIYLAPISLNTAHHVVLHRNGTRITVWVDNTLAYNGSVADYDVSGFDGYFLGKMTTIGTPGQFWMGDIYGAIIVNGTVNADTVNYLYNAGKDATCASLGGTINLTFASPTPTSGNKYYNNTINYIYANATAQGSGFNHTIIYLYNSTGLVSSNNQSINLALNYTQYNFTGLPVGTYTLNATLFNRTNQIANATARTYIIYSLSEPTFTNPSTIPFTTVAGRTNITWTNASIEPAGAVPIVGHTVYLLNYSNNASLYNLSSQSSLSYYDWLAYNYNLTLGYYYLRVIAVTNNSDTTNDTNLINLTRNTNFTIQFLNNLTGAPATGISVSLVSGDLTGSGTATNGNYSVLWINESTQITYSSANYVGGTATVSVNVGNNVTTIRLNPLQYNLYFDVNNNVTVQDGTNLMVYTNVTSIQLNLTDWENQTYVYVTFGVGQQYIFYNEQDDYINETLYYESFDYAKTVYVEDRGQGVGYAIVRQYKPGAGSTYNLVNMYLSNLLGEIGVKYDDDILYKFVANATGYAEATKLLALSSSSSERKVIELTPLTITDVIIREVISCPFTLTQNTSCYIRLITNEPGYVLNLTVLYANGTNVSDQEEITGILALDFDAFSTTLPFNVSLYINGVLRKNYPFAWFTENRTTTTIVNGTTDDAGIITDSEGESQQNKILTYILVNAMLLLLMITLAALANNYFPEGAIVTILLLSLLFAYRYSPIWYLPFILTGIYILSRIWK